MNIILSAHFDLAHPVPFIKLEEGKIKGLVDNFAGVFAAYQAHRKTEVPLYLTNFEENASFKGAMKVASKLDKENTLVIVVDTTKETDFPPDKQTLILNAYNFDTAILKEKFGERIHFMDGYFEQTEDETWA